jgi:hypothetical protein
MMVKQFSKVVQIKEKKVGFTEGFLITILKKMSRGTNKL